MHHTLAKRHEFKACLYRWQLHPADDLRVTARICRLHDPNRHYIPANKETHGYLLKQANMCIIYIHVCIYIYTHTRIFTHRPHTSPPLLQSRSKLGCALEESVSSRLLRGVLGAWRPSGHSAMTRSWGISGSFLIYRGPWRCYQRRGRNAGIRYQHTQFYTCNINPQSSMNSESVQCE